MGSDVDIDELKFVISSKIGINIAERIVDAEIERTIEGASALTVTLDDTEKDILQSGALTAKPDIRLDGLWFRFVGMDKNDDSLELTFEDREIAVLRTYNKKKGPVPRTKMTRAQFILSMIQEVKEFKIPYVIPELTVVQAIEQDTQTQPDWSGDQKRGQGLDKDSDITIKGGKPTAEAIQNINITLQVCANKLVSRKVMVIVVMIGIQESGFHNYDYPNPFQVPPPYNLINPFNKYDNPVGVFQQRRTMGWPATRDVAIDAAATIAAVAKEVAAHPEEPYGRVADEVQVAGTPQAFGSRRTEAERIVTEWGFPPGTAAAANAQAGLTGQVGAYAFYRGKPRTIQGKTVWEPENSWEAITRLADEVEWRAFFVSGTFYYLSEEYMFKSKVRMTIDEETDGVDRINGNYQANTKKAEITVDVRMGRWQAVPGSITRIRNMGPLSGRWITATVKRGLFDKLGKITLTKPRPVLPEPANDALGETGTWTGGQVPPDPGGDAVAITECAAKAIGFAQSQLGVPYQWGGEEIGVAFDCSGLTKAAYAAAGIGLPHNAQMQYDQGKANGNLVIGMPPALQAGDLVYYGTAGAIHHVAIFVGGGKNIEAPKSGDVVRVRDTFTYESGGKRDFFAATRPCGVKD